MNQWVAVDGGQSGLRLKILPDGKIGNGPGFRYQAGNSVSLVVSAVAQAAEQAQLQGGVQVLCLGLSGLPVDPEQLHALAYALSTRLDVEEVWLTTDVVTAHAGALQDRPGVVLAAGTGVVCMGVDQAGVPRRTDGWGHLFGDAGSAFDIGRQALVAVQRCHDGRGEPTELMPVAEQWFGVGADRLPQQLYRSETVVAQVAGFAPAVVSCAQSDDSAAIGILRQAAEELARTAASAVDGLGFDAEPVPIACLGRLWEAGSVLTDPFETELARLEPRFSMVQPAGDALDGAGRLALADSGQPGPDFGRYRQLVFRFGAEELGVIHTRSRCEPIRTSQRADVARVAHSSDDTRCQVPFPATSLIVSCQAQPDSPLYGPEVMTAMARAAIAGGATGIRVNGEADIAAVRSVTDQPVIGLLKQGSRSGVYITPTVAAAESVVKAGADIVAMDGTSRIRLDGTGLAEQIATVHRRGAIVMADVDTVQAGVLAREAGADLIATSLAGYTGEVRTPDEPDLELLRILAAELDCPVVAEGRYRTAEDMRVALEHGAYAVVIGTAITNPTAITRRLLTAVDRVE